jgi:hypothetical protein
MSILSTPSISSFAQVTHLIEYLSSQGPPDYRTTFPHSIWRFGIPGHAATANHLSYAVPTIPSFSLNGGPLDSGVGEIWQKAEQGFHHSTSLTSIQ